MALLLARRGGTVARPGQADADKVTASLADGVLTVTVPKFETNRARRIEVIGA